MNFRRVKKEITIYKYPLLFDSIAPPATINWLKWRTLSLWEYGQELKR